MEVQSSVRILQLDAFRIVGEIGIPWDVKYLAGVARTGLTSNAVHSSIHGFVRFREIVSGGLVVCSTLNAKESRVWGLRLIYPVIYWKAAKLSRGQGFSVGSCSSLPPPEDRVQQLFKGKSIHTSFHLRGFLRVRKL